MLAASCTGPAPSGAPASPDRLAVRVEPAGGVIYKIEDDLEQENWDLSLVAEGPAASVDRLRFVHRSGGAEVQTVELAARALRQREGSATTWRYLNFRLPQALEVDEIEASLLSGSRVVGHVRVPLRRYRQTSRYRLPLQGCWLVSSGHDFGGEHRRHYGRGHFAWDFIRVDAEGRPASGDDLASYDSFGQPVLAPADGTVVMARDGFEDLPPGRAGPVETANVVAIDHGGGVRSRLAHLRKGSVLVRAGDRVTSGQPVGAIGNSGSTEQPHLHLQFEDDREAPLPVRLSGYRVTWNQATSEHVELGRPRRGQFVCTDPPAAAP